MIDIPKAICTKVDFQVDLDSMIACVNRFVGTLLSPENPQLCLTRRRGSNDPLYEGAGTARYPDEEFSILNDIFAGTEFERFHLLSPVPLGRVRLMYLPPRQSYSFHKDTEPRLHVAIVTNPAAFLMVDAGKSKMWRIHIPADGKVYNVDTTLMHTAINGGLQPRIHLVANILKRPSSAT